MRPFLDRMQILVFREIKSKVEIIFLVGFCFLSLKLALTEKLHDHFDKMATSKIPLIGCFHAYIAAGDPTPIHIRRVHRSMLLRCLGWRKRKRDDHTFFFFFSHTFTFQLLDKPWSQVSSLLLSGSCLQFLSRIGFSNPTARRMYIDCC